MATFSLRWIYHQAMIKNRPGPLLHSRLDGLLSRLLEMHNDLHHSRMHLDLYGLPCLCTQHCNNRRPSELVDECIFMPSRLEHGLYKKNDRPKIFFRCIIDIIIIYDKKFSPICHKEFGPGTEYGLRLVLECHRRAVLIGSTLWIIWRTRWRGTVIPRERNVPIVFLSPISGILSLISRIMR